MTEGNEINNQNINYLTCKIHKKKIINIDLNPKTMDKLVCLQCMIKNQLIYEYMIPIDELINNKQNSIVQNLPPNLLNEEMMKYLNKIQVQQSQKEELTNEVNLIFEQYKQDMLLVIENQKQQILQLVNQIEVERLNIYKIYNEITQRQDIVQQFNKFDQTTEELNSFLKKYESENQITLDNNSKKISDQLFKHQFYINCFNTNKLKGYLSSIIMNLRNTNLLFGHPQVQRQQLQTSQQTQGQPEQSIQQQQTQKQPEQQILQQSQKQLQLLIQQQGQQPQKVQQLTQLNVKRQADVLTTPKYNQEQIKKIKRNEQPQILPLQKIQIAQQENQYPIQEQNKQQLTSSLLPALTKSQSYPQQQQTQFKRFQSQQYANFSQQSLNELIVLNSIQKLKEYQQKFQPQKIQLLLEDQQIGSCEIQFVYAFLLKQQALSSVHIDLRKNNLKNEDIKQLSNALLSCKNLTSISINLTENLITEEMKQNFKISFKSSKIVNPLLVL